MGLQLVQGPALEPVTLGEAKQHCRVEIPDDDALIAGYILAARDHVERETRRAIITQTWDLRIDSHLWNRIDSRWPIYWAGGRYGFCTGIELPRPPLQSVTSVSYVDLAGVSQVLAANQYQVVVRNGQSGEGLIVPAYGVSWPDVRDQPDAVTVRFVAGYGGSELVPHAIRQAMLLLIGHWHEHRESVVVGSTVAELPMAVQALLFPFRVF